MTSQIKMFGRVLHSGGWPNLGLNLTAAAPFAVFDAWGTSNVREVLSQLGMQRKAIPRTVEIPGL